MLIETPAARNTDPESSHEAAEEHTRSGRRNRQQMQVLEALRKCSFAVTSAELADRSGICRYVCAKRLPELEAAGLVYRGREDGGKPVKTRCSVTGKSACFWWPVPQQDRLI